MVLTATLVAVLAGGAAEVAAQARMSGPPEGYIEIDGSKDPDAIPLYLAWRHAFRVLRGSAHGAGAIRASVKLSPTDGALLDAEADKQRERDQRCEKRQLARLGELEKLFGKYLEMKPEQQARTYAALEAVEMECRQEVLDAADWLLSKMTPEGWVELERWVLEARTGIQALVHKKNLDTFRLPR